jgi:2'-5' RNA ligase
MLYPFFDIKPKNSESFDEEKLDLLSAAVKKCEPFQVSLDSFGTFGGQHRGVLYLYPRSFRDYYPMQQSTLSEEDSTNEEPLIQLQSILQDFLPECDDQQKNGKYTPHITLSHFPSLEEALDGQAKLETWWQSKEFIVNEIYVLKRIGDDGQFKILASLPLGENTLGAQVHEPPIVFPGMPLVEEGWVREERMALKARRNGNGSRGKRRNGRRKKGPVDRGPSKTRDTPEVIAKKRAERAAKGELLAQEAAAISAAIGGDDSFSTLF